MKREESTLNPASNGGGNARPAEGDAGLRTAEPCVREVSSQIVEIVSDSGEGAQTAGQLFGTVCAKMGNGIWTVEIIPAEIEPPSRSRAGASGIRIRFGTEPVTNMGDGADAVVALNEQVLYSRIDQGGLRPGTLLLIDQKWAASPDARIAKAFGKAIEDFYERGYDVRQIPIEEQTGTFTDDPHRGKNMWVAGLLCALYSRDLDIALDEVQKVFERRRKGQEVIARNHEILRGGYAWGLENLDARFDVPCQPRTEPMVVMNGNAAVATGCMAAGIELCSMYPITPSRSGPPTRGRRRCPSPPAPAWRSRPSWSGWPAWRRSRWCSWTCSGADPPPGFPPRWSRETSCLRCSLSRAMRPRSSSPPRASRSASTS
jgi:2-oxoglutarate ferredoxin oxidoreductase subunit alpha